MLTLILAFASLIFMAHILYEGAHFGSKEQLKEYPKSETDDFAKMIEIKDSVKREFAKNFAKGSSLVKSSSVSLAEYLKH